MSEGPTSNVKGDALDRVIADSRAVIDALPDRACVTDLAGRVRHVSPSFIVWLANNDLDADVVGKSLNEAFPFFPDDFFERFSDVIERQAPNYTRHRVSISAVGSVFQATRSLIVVDGEILGVIAAVRDVSENAYVNGLREAQITLAQTFNEAGSVDEVLEACLPQTIEITGRDGGGVYLLNEAKDALILSCHLGFSEQFVNNVRRIDADDPRFKHVMAGDLIRLSHDEIAACGDSVVLDEGLRAYGCVPLVYRSEVIGCINIASRTQNAISDRVARSLEIIGHQVGSAIGRLRMEEALRHSKETYRLIYDSVSDGLAIHDPQTGEILGVNRTFREMLGLPAKGLNFTIADMSAPGSGFTQEEGVRRIRQAAQGEPQLFEWHARHSDGTVFWIEVSLRKARIHGDDRLLAVARDISKRRQAEDELRESERARLAMLANLPGMGYRCANDREWSIEFVSDGCKELTGYRPEQLLGNRDVSYSELIHPDDREVVWNGVQEGLERGDESYRLYYRIIDASGQEKWVWERGRGVYDSDGNLLALEGLIIDISDRRRAEEALQDARDTLEQRVDERTADLTFANERLLDQIAERRRMEGALRRRAQFEELISSLTARFVDTAPADMDGAIHDALTSLSQFVDADRGFVFRFSANHTLVSNTHEWCREGVEPQSDNMQDVPVDTAPWMMGRLSRFEDVLVPRVVDLPDDAAEERRIAEGRSARSFIIVPMIYRGFLIGLLGLDAVREEREWSRDVVDLLRIASGSIASALEHKRVEAQTSEALDKFETVLDVSRDMVYQLDVEANRISYVSPSVERILGFTPEEFIGLPRTEARERVHPDDRRRLDDYMERIHAQTQDEGRPSSVVEFRWRTKRGEYCWLGDSRAVLHAADGTPLSVVGAVRDITEQREAAEALRESEARFRQLAEVAFEGLVIYRDGVVLDTNHRFAEMFGYQQSEIIGRPLLDLAPPEIRDHVAKLIAPPTDDLREFHVTHKSGARFYVEAQGRDIVYKGETARVITIRDITARKEIEVALRSRDREIRHAQRLAALGQLAAGVAHEMNQPLSAIMTYAGNCEILLDREGGREQIADNLGLIKQQIRRAVDVARQIRQLNEKSGGDADPLNVDDTIREIVHFFEARLRLESIELEMRLDASRARVAAERIALDQVISNLITNSERAMSNSETRHLTIATQVASTGRHVRIIVSDTGVGLSPEQVERIYDPFYTTSEAGGGMGLGLSICHRIVTGVGGAISVEGEPGCGATFTVTLPAMIATGKESAG